MTKNERIKIVNERNEYYKNIEEESRRYEESIKEDAFSDYNSRIKALDNNISKTQYADYAESVKKLLLTEALEYLFILSTTGGKLLSESSKNYAKQLIANYINETGVGTLISNMNNRNTLFLTSITECIENSYMSILEKVDKNNHKTFCVSDDDIETFYDSLDTESFENASDLIRMRVSSAIEEFIYTNKEDKSSIEDLLKTTKDKIDSIDINNKNSDKIEETYTRDCNYNINNIRTNRKHTIFEELVFKNTNQIIKNNSLLESFSNDGQLNMESIIEHTNIAYTFLELLNSVKIENCDTETIKNIIKI